MQGGLGEGKRDVRSYGIFVSDDERSRDFYPKATASLGITVGASGDGWMMLGRDGQGFWLGAGEAPSSPTHFAFAAESRAEVDAFHAAALAAGGRDNGKLGLRDYGPNSYVAFVLDPDGHNVEAVCRKAG